MLTAQEHGLQHTSPEEQGVASAAILEFIEKLERQVHDIHSLMLVRHGHVIAEGWWSPYNRDDPHMLYSLSKSFTSTAVGIAVAEGYFSIDDPVLPFFPDEAPAEVNDFLAAMRVRHLLSMSTGQAEDTWGYMGNRADGNWIKAFFGVPVLHEPGTHFLYNTGATYMLSAIVQKTTGLKLVDFLQPCLFEPLGIHHACWEESPQGINLSGIGLYLTTEAVARFGQLYLQKGLWQGQQIISEAWVGAASALQVSNGDNDFSDWTQGYGYQFWRCRHGAYRGDGAFGQYCVMMPEQDAVLVITGGMELEDMQQPLDFLWELLPLMQHEPLPDDAAAQQHLAEKLATLAMPPVKGSAISAVVATISGRTYTVDTNALHVYTVGLIFSESGCELRFITTWGEEIIPCGYSSWRQGRTSLFNQQANREPNRVAASGAWTSDDSFTVMLRLVETPFYHTLVFYFAGDELLLETWVNLSFESQRKILLTAQK